MYLRCDEYISGYDFEGEESKSRYLAVLKAAGYEGYGAEHSPGVSVEITVAYWRKANQIHKWFVEVVQGGKDECEPNAVSREQLTQLRDLCQKAIDEKDQELLPTQEGFFFGGTGYDEWYWQDLQDTVEQLNRVLTISSDGKRWMNFVYQSSW